MSYSSIKPKTGKCPDCNDGQEKPVTKVYRIGKDGEKENVTLCSTYHYKKFRTAENAKKKTSVASRERKKNLNVFFAAQILTIPRCCENCGNRLILPDAFARRAAICHIVPKCDFNSVETHPQNRWFGCMDCHTRYDKDGHNKQALMPVAPVVIERFRQFKHLITPREAARLPEYLYNEYYATTDTQGAGSQGQSDAINRLV